MNYSQYPPLVVAFKRGWLQKDCSPNKLHFDRELLPQRFGCRTLTQLKADLLRRAFQLKQSNRAWASRQSWLSELL